MNTSTSTTLDFLGNCSTLSSIPININTGQSSLGASNCGKFILQANENTRSSALFERSHVQNWDAPSYLRKSRLLKTQRYLATIYEENVTIPDFKTVTDLNTSTRYLSLFNIVELESLSPCNDQQEFDWINNSNPYERIKHLRDLQKNWDSYGATSFSQEHIDKAIRVYRRFLNYSFSPQEDYLDIGPFVAPCSDGSILLEWAGYRFPIRQLELLILPDISRDLQFLKTSENLEEEGEIHENELSTLFRWLFEGVK